MLPLHGYGGEEGFLLGHRTAVDDVFVYVLQAIVTHTTKEEPGANVLVLCSLRYCLRCVKCPPIDKHQCKMAWEFALVLANKSPLGELLGLGPLDVETAYFVAAEFIPEHLVREVQVEAILFGVGAKELGLGH